MPDLRVNFLFKLKLLRKNMDQDNQRTSWNWNTILRWIHLLFAMMISVYFGRITMFGETWSHEVTMLCGTDCDGHRFLDRNHQMAVAKNQKMESQSESENHFLNQLHQNESNQSIIFKHKSLIIQRY